MADIGEQKVTVRFGDVDMSDRLALFQTFDYFQEAAIRHAEDLGVGRSAMAGAGRGWVLSRISVVLEKRPKYREEITVRSWPRGWEKLFAKRDYDILGSAGEIVARSRSGWLIVDLKTRRPIRPQPIVDPLPKNEGLDALPEIVSLGARDNLTPQGERTAYYSDIDYNGHVNNTRYVQWIQDVTNPDALAQADSLRLDINYLNETKLGEKTELWTAPLADGFAYEGRRQGATVFRAELRIF
jgi:acyl-ACP thioesterase